MKLLAVRLARSIWLVPQYFLNPQGLYLRPARQLLKERYGFISVPGDQETLASKEGLKFADGFFTVGDRVISITNMTLHADGIVVDTRSSTADSDAFLNDALTAICREFGLPSHTELPAKRVYASELNVVFDREPRLLNPKLDPFLSEVTATIGIDLGFIGLTYGPDQSLSERPPFRFEREIKTPFQERRFYSFAPIQTDDHLRLLQKLEGVS